MAEVTRGVAGAVLDEPATADDFADVYRIYLTPIWRYVRSRIWAYHDAQDVTAEVFTRAWRSWPAYNPRRGPVAPWLFRIAQRAVADWHRRRPRETVAAPESSWLDQPVASVLDSLDPAILDRQMLTRLGQALAGLSDRDRDCVALRFAGELKLAEVAEVLGVSTPAAKMALSRALQRLAAAIMAPEESPAGQAPALAALDEVVDRLAAGGSSAVSSARLQELISHVSALHQPKMPPELPARLAACIACAERFSATAVPHDRDDQGARGPRTLVAERHRPAPLLGLGWAAGIAPICLACTIPVLLVPLLALGLSFGLTFGLHLIALVTAPLVFWVLWRHFARHRDRLAVWVGGIGALALAIHFPLHFLPDEGGPLLFALSDQLGTGLLLAGAFLDWRAMRRWLAAQRTRLEELAPALVAA